MLFKFLLRTLHRSGAAPVMSDTERAALEAGDVWLDAELFSGKPRFERWLEASYPSLTERERAFIDGPVREVVAAMDPELNEKLKEIPPNVWKLLRKHRFFGLGIPESHGGHGFSALAQSTIFGLLGSRSMPLSSVVLIPNSVGPGELLVEKGTEAQKDYYLPRLAKGDEIPCFALTEPHAGSDAGSLTASGVLFRDGEQLKIRLHFEKRYITLAPIATLIGLAFRLFDPDRLLGEEEDLGITCALVDASLPGVETGTRHDPLGIPFPNGPIRGRDVVIDADQIIGGVAQAGQGWQMLMEALSGGRAVSLPGQSTVAAKYTARVAGAYSMVRRQFGLPVGRFEGVEEPLARIAGRAYLMEAARVFTCGALDDGLRPAVVSALMKYNCTELGRRSTQDGMDILGGAAICLGPRNLMARAWQASPIGITVEGANILTRTLIVFGQGAVRCHPHAHALLESIRGQDLPAFRKALIGYQLSWMDNGLRSALLGLTRGRGAPVPFRGAHKRHAQRLAWASAKFAFYADLSMTLLGGSLKFRGKITGRLADILSWMFLVGAAIKRFEAEGRRREDEPLLDWACETGFDEIQRAFEDLLANLPIKGLRWWLRGPASWWARLNPIGRGPSDAVGKRAADVLRVPGEARDRLTSFLYIHPGSPWDELEQAFTLAHQATESTARLRQAMRRGRLTKGAVLDVLDEAVTADLVTAAEADLIRRAETACREAVQVDETTLEALRGYVDEPASDRDAAGG